jgi:hypothetical protein
MSATIDIRENAPTASLLKNAIVAFFNLAKCEAKLRTARKITPTSRGYFVIASMRCNSLLIQSTGC